MKPEHYLDAVQAHYATDLVLTARSAIGLPLFGGTSSGPAAFVRRRPYVSMLVGLLGGALAGRLIASAFGRAGRGVASGARGLLWLGRNLLASAWLRALVMEDPTS